MINLVVVLNIEEKMMLYLYVSDFRDPKKHTFRKQNAVEMFVCL